MVRMVRMKLTLRDLFLLTLIAAIVLGWWVDRSRLEASRNRAEIDVEHERILAGQLLAVLRNDGRYEVSLQNGISVQPVSGSGGPAFFSTRQVHEHTRSYAERD